MKKSILVFMFLLVTLTALTSQNFIIGRGGFYKDGEIYRVISGSMHYSRIPEAAWKDRLTKARAMGLNTISTAVFWNFHEEEEGFFDFTSGRKNLRKFIEIAGEVGLNVILKPGPYVSSEWDMGGIPYWLLTKSSLKFRSDNPEFIKQTKNYLEHLLFAIDGLQYKNGGPIIMMQIENEYGSFGNDKNYLASMQTIFTETGFNIPLITSDSSEFERLEAGSIEEILPTINFSEDPEENFATLEKYREDIPHFAGAYNVGKKVRWGDLVIKDQSISKQIREMKWMLENDKSFNIYMFHGGTNFGFTAGANHVNGIYLPLITSYDYGAPLTENGEITKEYTKMKKLLEDYQNIGETILPPIPKKNKKARVNKIKFKAYSKLIYSLGSDPKISSMPLPLEEYGLNSGIIVYKTTLRGQKNGTMMIEAPHDIAHIYLDGDYIRTIKRNDKKYSFTLPKVKTENPELIIIIEVLGRINFGPELMDSKGITKYVTLNEVNVMNWEVYPIPFTEEFLAEIPYNNNMVYNEPAFFAATFKVRTTGDIHLKLKKWTSGVVVINGKVVGRYRNEGPQDNLFVPGSWLHKGLNTIYLLDMGMEHLPTISIAQ